MKKDPQSLRGKSSTIISNIFNHVETLKGPNIGIQFFYQDCDQKRFNNMEKMSPLQVWS